MPDTPTIRSLSSRHADKNARAIFNLSALLIAPLPDGTFAICDRGQSVYIIVSEPPTREQFNQFYQLLNVSRISAEGAFHGEPSDRDFAKDLQRAANPPRAKPATVNLENLI